MKLLIIAISLLFISCEKSNLGRNKIFIDSVVSTPKGKESITIKNETGKDVDLHNWSIGELNNPNSYLFPTNTILNNESSIVVDSLIFEIKDSGAIIYLRDNTSKTIDNWKN